MSLTKDDILFRLARYQEANPDQSVRCLLCPHQCLLPEGQYGLCRSRINMLGALYTLNYGNLCALSVDPIEKKPLFHFFPGMKILSMALRGCNFRCLNCQNWELSQATPEISGHFDMSPQEVVEQALSRKLSSLAFTYTEPTVFYEFVLDTAKEAKSKGLKTVLISNGYINEQPLLELIPWIDAANIDLKCFDEKLYPHLTGGQLQPVLETLKILKAQGVWLEITNLLIPGLTDKPDSILAMCQWLVENGFEDTPLHFSRFFPNYKLMELPPTMTRNLVQAKDIAERTGIKHVYVGNIPALYAENTHCPTCKNLLVERIGYEIRKNELSEGMCGFCGTPISGQW